MVLTRGQGRIASRIPFTQIGNIGLRPGESKTVKAGGTKITLRFSIVDDGKPEPKREKRRAWCLWLCKH